MCYSFSSLHSCERHAVAQLEALGQTGSAAECKASFLLLTTCLLLKLSRLCRYAFTGGRSLNQRMRSQARLHPGMYLRNTHTVDAPPALLARHTDLEACKLLQQKRKCQDQYAWPAQQVVRYQCECVPGTCQDPAWLVTLNASRCSSVSLSGSGTCRQTIPLSFLSFLSYTLCVSDCGSNAPTSECTAA